MRARSFALIAGSGAAMAAASWWGASFLPVPPVTLSKETTYITEPLRDDGTPDYALWLNRKHGAGVTPANNAAIPLMGSQLAGDPRDVLDAIGIDPAKPPAPLGLMPPTSDDEVFAKQRQRALRAPWTDADAPLVAQWLEANRTPLERLEEIVRSRPRYFVPLARDLAMDTATHTLLSHRTATEALRARALRSARLGASDAAIRDCGTALRLGGLLDQGISLVEHLVASAVLESAAEAAIALANPPAGRASAAALSLELKRLPGRPSYETVLEQVLISELAGYLDLYRAARRSPAAWEARVAAVAKVMREMALGLGADSWRWSWERVPRWAVDWDELLRTVIRCNFNPACDPEQTVAHADLSRPVLLRLVALGAVDPSARRRLARALLTDRVLWHVDEPGFGEGLRRTWRGSEALLRVARVAAAAAARHTRDGRYPDRAAALSDALDFDPEAPRDGYVFRYTATAGGTLFSYTAEPATWSSFGRVMCADSSGRLAQNHNGMPIAIVDGLCDKAAPTRVAREADTRAR
jgi:hypothetical protein